VIYINRTEFEDLDAFYHEIKKQQTAAHGLHWTIIAP
jgi:hypothetical protein